MSNTEYGPRPQRVMCQLGFIRTFPGILKLIQFVCDVIALIIGLIAPSTDYTGQRGFFIFVAAFALVVTTILFILAIINVQGVCMPERWLVIEMFWCAFISLLYLIASIIVAVIAKYHPIYGAAAFFGFSAFIAYIFDALNRFRLTRAGPAGLHAERHKTSITTTTITRQEPTY